MNFCHIPNYILLFVLFFSSCSSNSNNSNSINQKIHGASLGNELLSIRKKADSLRNVDLNKSMESYKYMLKRSKELNSTIGKIEAYRSIVFVAAAIMYQIDTALKYSDEAVDFGLALNDPNTLCDIYGNRALIFQITGNVDSAFATNDLALKYMDLDTGEFDNKNWPLYLNIAVFYSELNNQKLAIEYTNKYLYEYVIPKGDSNDLVITYSNKAIYYLRMDDYLNSKISLDSSRIYINPNNKALKAINSIYHNYFFYFKNYEINYDSAKFYLKKYIDISQPFNNPSEELKSIIGLMTLAEDTDDDVIKKDILLKFQPDKYLKNNTITYSLKSDLAYFYAIILQDFKRDQEAISYFKLSHMLRDSNEIYITNKKMDEFEVERTKVLQENKLLANELKLKNKNYTIIILIIGLIFILGVTAFIYLWLKKKNDLLKIEKEFEIEKSALQGQLEERNRISRELHDDLGASLTSIALSGEILKYQNPQLKDDLELIANSAHDTVDTLNEIVWSLNSRNDSLHGLIAYIRKFATNFLSKVNISVAFNENLPIEDLEVSSEIRRNVYLTSKEAINNIVKHSNGTKVNIYIDFNETNKLLTLIIKDNGNANINNKHSGGNGLLNMKKNMELINGKFEMNYANGWEIKLAVSISM